jgi:membrane protease YdiL (CAAX protease family)
MRRDRRKKEKRVQVRPSAPPPEAAPPLDVAAGAAALPAIDETVPWNTAEIGVVVALYFGLTVAVMTALYWSGFYQSLYGRGPVDAALNPNQAPNAAEQDPAVQATRLRAGLWAECLSLPLQALAIPLALYRMCGARPAQLGLTAARLGRNAGLGALAGAAVTPPLLAIHLLVIMLYQWAGVAGTHKHPFEQLSVQGLAPLEGVLLVVAAVAAAPLREELLFRGVLQPWLAKNAWGGAAALAAALVFAILAVWNYVAADATKDVRLVAADLAPAFFILALVPAYLVVRRRSRTPAGPAIFAASALFASVHSGYWPAPVALFPLALALGWLAHRTRSLVGPIVLHSLFNAVSCVLLLFWPGQG